MDIRLLRECLVSIYDESTANWVAPRLDELLHTHSKQLGSAQKRNTQSLSERDVLLITYPDQVREAEVPPLQTLTTLLDTHLSTVVSGVHILPFLL